MPRFLQPTMRLIHGECLAEMAKLPAGSIDMVLCDLPYGTTACKWDTVIPFDPLWTQYKRLMKPNGAVVLTACQPFTSALVMSNAAMFRYELIWEKPKPIGFLYAARRPLACHENVLVFADGWTTYNPQKTPGEPFDRGRCRATTVEVLKNGSAVKEHVRKPNVSGDRHPRSVRTFANAEFDPDSGLHPTQKPVALTEYLIKTYTNPGDTVLDNCMGSGTTGVACKNLGRGFIGIERDPAYFQIAQGRILGVANA
jgi:DNA modification methylase